MRGSNSLSSLLLVNVCYFLTRIFAVMQETAVVTREVLSDIAMNLNALPLDTLTAVAHYTLEKIQPRVMSFEEQV